MYIVRTHLRHVAVNARTMNIMDKRTYVAYLLVSTRTQFVKLGTTFAPN